MVPTKKQPSGCTWDELFGSDTIPLPRPDGVDAGEHFLLGETVVAASGDICRVGSWVFYRSPLVCYCVFLNLFPYKLMNNFRQRDMSQLMERGPPVTLQWQGVSLRLLQLNTITNI